MTLTYFMARSANVAYPRSQVSVYRTIDPLVVIEPVLSFDKFIDVMGLNENYLICIFMNINENLETRGKTEKKTIAIAMFWMGYKIYLTSLKSILMAASVVRGAILIPLKIVFNNEHICMIHSFPPPIV